MKNISNALKQHMAEEVTTLCTCWEVRRKDGVNMYFTDLDSAILFGGNVYLPAVGYNKSALESSSDMTVDNMDIEGLLDDDTITVEDIKAGKFNGAEVRIFVINWENTSMGILRLKRGFFGEVQIKPNGTFKVELRGLNQALMQPIGDMTSPECRNDLGDSLCQINIDGDGWPRMAIVTEVSSRSVFKFAITDPLGADPRASDSTWYQGGVLSWLSGLNESKNIEVKFCDSVTGEIQLFLRMDLNIQIGDTFILRPGCDKRRSTCFSKFNNVLNMNAEPDKPGMDLLTQYPNMPYQN